MFTPTCAPQSNFNQKLLLVTEFSNIPISSCIAMVTMPVDLPHPLQRNERLSVKLSTFTYIMKIQCTQLNPTFYTSSEMPN